MTNVVGKLEKTFERRLSIFWCFIWRAIAGSVIIVLAGAALSLIFGRISGAGFHYFYELFDYIVAMPVEIIWQFVAFRMALEKHYKGFCIVLVPISTSQEPASTQV